MLFTLVLLSFTLPLSSGASFSRPAVIVSWVSSPLQLCLKSHTNVMPTSFSISILHTTYQRTNHMEVLLSTTSSSHHTADYITMTTSPFAIQPCASDC